MNRIGAFLGRISCALKRERFYVLIFLFLIAFFAFSLAFRYHAPEPSSEVSLDQTIEQLDDVMRLRAEDPAYLKQKFLEHPLLGRLTQGFMAAFFLAMVAGVLMNLDLARRWIWRKPWLPAGPRSPAISWGVSEVVKVLLLFLFCSALLELIFFLAEPFLPEALNQNFLLLFHTTFTDLLIVGFMGHFIRKLNGNTAASFGWSKPFHWLGEIGWGMKAYVAILPGFMALLAAVLYVSGLFHYEPPPHPLAGIFIEESGRAPWLIVYSLFLGCCLGPAIEELFFRGFLYPAARKKWGAWPATFVTAFLFALVHESSFAFLPIFFLGAALCRLYEKRGNVVSCMSLHVLHNVVFVSYFFLAKSVLLDG